MCFLLPLLNDFSLPMHIINGALKSVIVIGKKDIRLVLLLFPLILVCFFLALFICNFFMSAAVKKCSGDQSISASFRKTDQLSFSILGMLQGCVSASPKRMSNHLAVTALHLGWTNIAFSLWRSSSKTIRCLQIYSKCLHRVLLTQAEMSSFISITLRSLD